MRKNSWIINKTGLLNFWYYDEEEFNFLDGKLLLRGANGSGKSVTMQSFIPLLLDGNKSPERLDPFGSRARKLENYLLGEQEHGKDESTGYIYMEFKKANTENYLTIGMGLRARRGKTPSFWGFVITDGRRVGRDIFLYKDMGGKVPLSKKQLKNRIGEGGEVVDGQREYMGLVNKHIFGFDEIEDYDELIKLLIQLRTPKLSKEFKPTVIYEIMNNSLQPLSDDDLRPMSEAIENMDNIKIRLEELKVSKKAADKLKKAYDDYNRFTIFSKAKDFIKSQDNLNKLLKDKGELNKSKDEYILEAKKLDKEIEDMKIQQSTLEEKKKELEKHDSYRIKEELSKIEKILSILEDDQNKKEEILNRKRDQERELYQQIKKLVEKEEIEIKNIKEIIEEMDELAEEIKFHEQFYMKDELFKTIKSEYDFSYIEGEHKKYKEKIQKGKTALEKEERLKREYDKAYKESEDSIRKKEERQKALDQANILMSETKEEFIENIYTWRKNNKELVVSDDALIVVSRNVNNYGEDITFDDIVGEIRNEYNKFESSLNRERDKLSNEVEKLDENLKKKLDELTEWKNKRDPEPERLEGVNLNRERLKEQNIPHLPLYMTIDFNDDLSDEERGILEEALIDMGLLDALVIPSEYEDKVLDMDRHMSDKYIFAHPKFLNHELSTKLRVDKINIENIEPQRVDDILKSILLNAEAESTYIKESGEYGIGPIKGRVTTNHRAKYIGASARKRFRLETIEKLEIEYKEIEVEIDKIQRIILQIEVRIEILRKEYFHFPSKDDLETALNNLKEANFLLDQSKREALEKENQLKIKDKQLQGARQEVYKLTNTIELPLNLEAYINALEDINEYRENLLKLEKFHLVLLQHGQEIITSQARKEEIERDIDDNSFELNKIQRNIKENISKHESLWDQLQVSNYEEIKEEINRCVKLLESLPEDIIENTKESERLKSKYGLALDRLKDIENEIALQKDINNINVDGFTKEYSLKYVFDNFIDEEEYKIAKYVYRELREIESQGKIKDDYHSNLQEKFHQNKQYLTEYSPKIEYLFGDSMEVEAETTYNEEVQNIKLGQKRLDILGTVRGKNVNFYSLLEYIEESIDENERLLKESDRQMFEDILAKNISKKIRAKIYHSDNWVNKMNNLMESMNTSSGLSFSLNWKSKTAETEDQLDTNELVDLLKKDGYLLTEDEINRLSSHFRSKIEEARRTSEEDGQRQTFHSIMKEVLDYRRWFEFRLFFKKTNENKKEMTNNAFDKFSGGEKAMAMYVPLFSAVYAKYEGAREDCPRIISLDEAFAGVDENNIRDMFRLINELELNFIINSQILWGDYDTVKALSICELVRPNNANFVTVLRYKWNGKVKELLMDEGVDYEQREVAATML